MKRIFFGAATALTCFFYSCKDAKPVAVEDNAAKYKAANAVVYKAIITGDVSTLDSVIAKDAIDHGGDPSMSGNDIVGRDSIKATLAVVHTQFNNLKMEVLSSATDGDYTLERVRMTGTAAMPLGPKTPVGTPVDMTSVEVVKWKNGMAYEHWTYIDAKDVAKMSPAPPPPGNDDKMKPKMKMKM